MGRVREEKSSEKIREEKEPEERRCRCSGGSKSRLAQAADAEPSGQMSDDKLHAVVAGSTFPSQKC